MELKFSLPGSKCPVKRILDVNDIKTTNVLLSMHNDTSPAHVTSASDHDNVACIELNKVGDF